MIVFDDKTLQSVIRLQRDKDFQEVVKSLEIAQRGYERDAIRQQGIECNWTQGKAQVLQELIDGIGGAEETLNTRRKVATMPKGPVV